MVYNFRNFFNKSINPGLKKVGENDEDKKYQNKFNSNFLVLPIVYQDYANIK
jgi:hypothetical protein